MIVVRHYSNEYNSQKLHSMVKDFGVSCTDKSFFRPDISSVRAFLGSNAVTGSNKVGVYDFPDGVDNGDSWQLSLRSPGLDITELDAIADKAKKNLEKEIALQKSEKEIEHDKEIMDVMHKNIDKLANGEKPDSVESSDASDK